MTIINQETEEILVDNVHISEGNVKLSIEHALMSHSIDEQRVFFKKVPEFCKKKIYSKDWYWNGSKLVPYED